MSDELFPVAAPTSPGAGPAPRPPGHAVGIPAPAPALRRGTDGVRGSLSPSRAALDVVRRYGLLDLFDHAITTVGALRAPTLD